MAQLTWTLSPAGGEPERSTWISRFGAVMHDVGFCAIHQHGRGPFGSGVVGPVIGQTGIVVSVCCGVFRLTTSDTAQSGWIPGLFGSLSVGSTAPSRHGLTDVKSSLPMSASAWL